MIKRLLFPDVNTSPSLTGTSNCSCMELVWGTGKHLSASDCDFSNLEYWCETLPLGKMTDFAATDLGAPIVSKKLKKILDDLGVQAQYFPVSIAEKRDAQPKQGYYAMNIIGMVDCIDFDASDLEVEEEDGEIVDIIDVGTVVLKNEHFGNMYRMYMFERVIVVEGDLAEKLQDINVQGMKLMEPEKWDGILNEKD